MSAHVLRLPSARPTAPEPATSVAPARAAVRWLPRARAAAPYRTRPWARRSALLAADLGGLGVALATTVGVASAVGLALPLWPLAVAATLAVGGYAAASLYGSFLPAPAEEFRALALTTLAAFGAVALATFDPSTAEAVRSAAVLGAGVGGLALVMAGRATLRAAFGRARWWGCPVAVLGDAAPVRQLVRTLRAQPELGVRPEAVFYTDDAEGDGAPLSHAAHYAARHGVRDAVVVVEPGAVRDVAERYGYLFHRLLVVPPHDGGASLWVGTRDVAGSLGYEVRHRHHARWRRALKRALDLAASVAVAVAVVPLGLALAVAIRLDSPGPVFYRQDRIGRDGRCFRVWKFRTMYVGAHDRLRELLDRDPGAREEYERYAKLKDDPRVTRVGQFLRRTSLDELPQLANVLRGEMSLVGPRAYMPQELPKMGGREAAITRVLPGITGLWQVSGRNGLTFAERVELDRRYVQNWSVSLDLYLLARTVPTVLLGRGAS